jgi:membrane associated rhomboid family serine protease
MNLTPMVRNILFLNIGMFLITMFSPQIEHILALHAFQSPEFYPWQIITHIFLHAGIAHIFFNMFALISFGALLETFWGSKKFLVFYMICGIGAAFLHSAILFYQIHNLQLQTDAYLMNSDPLAFNSFVHDNFRAAHSQLLDFIEGFRTNPDNPRYIQESKAIVKEIYTTILNGETVGASGAVFGLLLAIGMLFPNTELYMMFIPVPIKAKYFVLGYGALELYLGFSRFEGDNVAHFAHLGGMLFGYILIKYWQRQRTDFY